MVVASLSSKGAPTTMVLVEIATVSPKLSPAPALEAFRYACWIQLVPLRTNT